MPSKKNTQRKTPWRREAFWDEWKEKNSAATTVRESDDKEKQYRPSRRVIYNNFCEATHTEKTQTPVQTSGEWGDFSNAK